MLTLRKSKRPHACALGTYLDSNKSTLSTLCDNESEIRSSIIEARNLTQNEISKTRYGKNFKTNDIVRKKLLEKITNNSNISVNSVKSVVHYRLFKPEYVGKHLAPLKPKWCEITEDNESINKAQRKISVIYKCPELKVHLQRYMEVIARKIKWSKRLAYSYIISQISPERIEVKSEIPITSLGPYLQILENPNLPLWEQLCKTIQLDTGHSVGDIVVNIHLIKGN